LKEWTTSRRGQSSNESESVGSHDSIPAGATVSSPAGPDVPTC
jgi:hypothetical protein